MPKVNNKKCYFSDYVIFQKINKNNYILIHTYFNNIDIIEEDIAQQLLAIKAEQDVENMDTVVLDELLQKCYLVEDKTADKERCFAVVDKLAETNNKHLTYTLIPSYACNFSCPYCFEGGVTRNRNNIIMDTKLVDIIFAIMEKEKMNGYSLSFSLFGGEPLRKENIEINRYIFKKAKEHNLKIAVITNGYDLDKYMAYIKNNIFSNFQITFDGTQEYHNKNKFTQNDKDTFSKLLNNIKLILKTRTKVQIQVRINTNKENLGSLKKLQNIFDKLNFTKDKRFSFYTKSVDECENRKHKETSDVDIVHKVKFSPNKVQNMYTNSQYSFIFKELNAVFSPKRKFGNFKIYFCGANGSNKLIDPLGDVYSCLEEVGKSSRKVGYVDQFNKKIIPTELAKEWAERTVRNIPECSECAYALICGGGCGVAAFKNKGALYMPWCGQNKEIAQEVICEIAKKIEV